DGIRDFSRDWSSDVCSSDLYWIFLATVPVLLVTGIVLWRPWIADGMPVWALRWAVTIHAYAAFIAIITLVIHIYSAIWVKGSIRAMTQGREIGRAHV